MPHVREREPHPDDPTPDGPEPSLLAREAAADTRRDFSDVADADARRRGGRAEADEAVAGTEGGGVGGAVPGEVPGDDA